MSANTLYRFSRVVLVANIAFTFVTAAHADNGRQKPTEKTTVTLQDALHIHIDIVEMSAATIPATTDQKHDVRQIAAAVRGAVDAGTGRIRYTFESQIIVGNPVKFTSAAREPFATNRKKAPDGKTKFSTGYQEVGCVVYLRTKWLGLAPEDGVQMNWSVDLSDVRTKSGVPIADDLDAILRMEYDFVFAAIAAPGDTIAFRAGAQRANQDDARITVILATLTAVQPKS
jgi:hypothetical protein